MNLNSRMLVNNAIWSLNLTRPSGMEMSIGPLQLGSRDHNFPKNIIYYGLQLKEWLRLEWYSKILRDT